MCMWTIVYNYIVYNFIVLNHLATGCALQCACRESEYDPQKSAPARFGAFPHRSNRLACAQAICISILHAVNCYWFGLACTICSIVVHTSGMLNGAHHLHDFCGYWHAYRYARYVMCAYIYCKTTSCAIDSKYNIQPAKWDFLYCQPINNRVSLGQPITLFQHWFRTCISSVSNMQSINTYSSERHDTKASARRFRFSWIDTSTASISVGGISE